MSKKAICINVEEPVWLRIKKRAKREGKSAAQLAREFLKKGLSK